MKNLLIAALLGSTALTGAALAQEATTPDAAQPVDAMQPMDGEEPMDAAATEDNFITWQAEDQMIASNLMGATVRGAENEDIGSVDDLLLDRDGQVIGVIVGVGGFLGIGQRDVAIPTEQLEFVLAQDVPATEIGVQDPALAPATDGTAPDGTMATDPTAMDGTTTAGDPAMTPGVDGTGMAADPAGDPAMTPGVDGTRMAAGPAGDGMMAWTGSVIGHIQVAFTRDQLEDAPAFETIE